MRRLLLSLAFLAHAHTQAADIAYLSGTNSLGQVVLRAIDIRSGSIEDRVRTMTIRAKVDRHGNIIYANGTTVMVEDAVSGATLSMFAAERPILALNTATSGDIYALTAQEGLLFLEHYSASGAMMRPSYQIPVTATGARSGELEISPSDSHILIGFIRDANGDAFRVGYALELNTYIRAYRNYSNFFGDRDFGPNGEVCLAGRSDVSCAHIESRTQGMVPINSELLFDPNRSDRLYATSSGMVGVLKVPTSSGEHGPIERIIVAGNPITVGVDYLSDGKIVVLTAGSQARLLVIDPDLGAVVREVPVSSDPDNEVFSARENFILRTADPEPMVFTNGFE